MSVTTNMSDNLRKNFSDKIDETITPDSQKSTLEKGKESVTNAADNLAGKVQPDADKGVAQKAADVGHDAKKDTHDASGSLLEDAQQKLHELSGAASKTTKEYLDQAGKYVNQASEYLQGKESK